MSYLLMLPLLLGQVAATEEPARREPPVRFGPCGVYDIGELEDHFLVHVEQRPDAFDEERIAITITLIDPAPEVDQRRPLPIEDLALEVRNEAGKTIASSPLHWRTTPYSLTTRSERLTTVTVLPSAAKQIILNRQPNFRGIDHFHLLVTFRSLEKKPK